MKHEDEVLICCALRFDGWKFIKDTGFAYEVALERFWATGQWELTPEEQLALFFMLQRGLYKWGLEREPRRGKYWRAFRSLFLEVYGYAIPDPYQHPQYLAEWAQRFEPTLPEWVNLVQHLHETTIYDDVKPTR